MFLGSVILVLRARNMRVDELINTHTPAPSYVAQEIYQKLIRLVQSQTEADPCV